MIELIYNIPFNYCTNRNFFKHFYGKRKRKISDSVLRQNALHPQKNPKSNVTTQKRHQKEKNTQLLRTDLGRSVGKTTATQLV